MVRPPCCDKANVKRGLWTAEEDAKILAYVSKHGTGNWTLVPKKAGLNRCGKSCRLRWTNYLRPDLKHDSFSPEEEQLIINYHQAIGSRWSVIAKKLPGRTDNDVKNYWNTKLRKKLEKMGIDPITHKPISQIFFDYKTISDALPTTTTTLHSLGQQEAPNYTTSSAFYTCFPSWNHLLQARRFTCSASPSPSSSSTVTTSPEPITPSFHPQITTYPPRTSSSFFMNKTLEPDLVPPPRMMINSTEASSSNGDAFVNALLDEDTRIQSEIGDLLDGILDY